MTDPLDRARAIHASLPVIDGHNDLPWALRTAVDGDLDAADPSGPLPDFHTDVPRLLEGGVGAQFWSVYVPADHPRPHAMTLRQIDLARAMIDRCDRLEPADTADDIRRIKAAGNVASLLGAEGGHAIEGSLDKLRALRRRGVRYMTLTHTDTIPWADSATDRRAHGGLTEFGHSVVREMNRIGMLVDISHVSEETMRHAIATSAAPVIASHSNARALAPHPRNIPDDVLRSVGLRGGVVMAVFFPGFVVADTARTMGGLYDVWRGVRARLAGDESAIAAELDRIDSELDVDCGDSADICDHIEHIADRAGIDSVGIGSDYDGMSLVPDDMPDVSSYPVLTTELLRRGWSEGDVRKVLGENTMRVLGAADAVATQTAM
jgi:membrane dipeptidase